MTKIHKQIILAVIMVLLGTLSWFFLHQLFYSEISITFLVGSIVGLLFWGVLICLGSLLINKKIVLYLAFALSLLSFFVFFHGAEVGPGQFRVALYYFVIMILIFITFLIYRARVQYEKNMRIKAHFWRILKKGLPLMFTAVCLLIASAYYFSPSLGEIFAKTEFQIPRSLIDTVLKPFGSLDEDLGDVVYDLVNSQISGSEGQVKEYLPIALAVGLFFSLRILVIILVPLMVLLSCLMVKFMIAVNFARVDKKAIEAEVIEL